VPHEILEIRTNFGQFPQIFGPNPNIKIMANNQNLG